MAAICYVTSRDVPGISRGAGWWAVWRSTLPRPFLPDFRHLARRRDLLDASGGRFVRGIVLHTGDQVLSFGDRLVAMPLAALWWPRRPDEVAAASR